MPETYLTITIDTECDRSPDWSTSNPLAFESVLRAMPGRLQPLFMQAGAVPTYLLSNEVMESGPCVAAIRGLPGRFELGTHLHADYVEPARRYSNYAGMLCDDFQTDYPPEVEFAKLENLTGLFQSAFGRAPKVFRSGRFAANGNTIRSLARLGYLVDTSVTPGMVWKSRDGVELSYADAPDRPYFASPEDICKPGDGGVFEVPVTIVPSLSIPLSLKRLKPSHRLDWLRPVWSSTATMKRIIDIAVGRSGGEAPRILNMMFHSMELIPNASPYTRTQGDVEKYLDSLREVLRHARARGVKFTDLEGVRALFG